MDILQSSSSNRGNHDYSYQPSVLEDFVMTHIDELGFNESFAPLCKIWRNGSALLTEIDTELQMYLDLLDDYSNASENFQRISQTNKSLVKDITQAYRDGQGRLSWDDASKQVCESVKIPLPRNASKLLSHSSHVGFLEAILPPMRHPGFCKATHGVIDLRYLVHDFYTMCRSLKPTSRIILIDMGASLDFHEGSLAPPIYLISKLRQFGFYIDHIYAFEAEPQDPAAVYKLVPNELLPAYHWINVPVQFHNETYLNPLQMVLHELEEEDLVFVKLDIDNPGLELPLVNQLISSDKEEERKRLSILIDHFYFEYHVTATDIRPGWNHDSTATIKDSLVLFQTLRKNGIASHFWP